MCELINRLLSGERRLRGTRRTIWGRLGHVRQDVVAVDAHVLKVVGGEDAGGGGTGIGPGIRATLHRDFGRGGNQLAVLRRAELDFRP